MNLLFDFGGVLVDLDKSRCIAAFDAIGFDIRPLIGTYAQAGILSQLERGKITVPEFCEQLRQLSGKPQLTDEAIVGAWEHYLLDVPEERLEMLLKIKRHYPLYVLSNTNVVHWDMARDRYFRYKGLQLEDFFDKVFLSYELGVEKPDPAIYRAVAEGIGCDPADILFFDDSNVNCRAARQCGLQSLLAPAGSLWFGYFDEDGRLNGKTEADLPSMTQR